ncbi:MAG TPA: ABC transporter ATP-binding protein [Blastocatellia bacterium]|nr:ABC transporter ATP-binding protein [Blastocatellia bacterium]
MENGNGKPAVGIRALRKSFGRQKVLDGIDLDVRRGETLTVLGRSGTGKSVLLKLIIGLQKPDEGSIEIFDKDITGLRLEELNQIRKKIGFLFQQAALYDSLTVEENVAFPLRRHTDKKDDEIRDRVRGLLERVGMQKDLKKMPADISGGMKKRVGLARALALDPEVMLLDEPTAGLDPITTEEIDELIEGLRRERGITSIVVTHDMQSVRRLADRVAMLRDGNIVAEGTLDELKESRDRFVAEFLQNENKPQSQTKRHQA